MIVKPRIRPGEASCDPVVKPGPLPDMPAHHTLASTAASTAAVVGFLRGVERRAALLAELQCGDAEHGDRALASAIEAFGEGAPGIAPEEWPLLFWTTLLQSPALNAEPLAPYWHGDFASLARLDFGTRAVLLLRVVVGLDDAQAAAVFGVDPAEYKRALQRALPQRDDGSLDGEAWLALNDEARFVMKQVAPERVAAIARLRDAALAAKAGEPAKAAAQGTSTTTRSRWLGKLWTSVGLG